MPTVAITSTAPAPIRAGWKTRPSGTSPRRWPARRRSPERNHEEIPVNLPEHALSEYRLVKNAIISISDPSPNPISATPTVGQGPEAVASSANPAPAQGKTRSDIRRINPVNEIPDQKTASQGREAEHAKRCCGQSRRQAVIGQQRHDMALHANDTQRHQEVCSAQKPEAACPQRLAHRQAGGGAQ